MLKKIFSRWNVIALLIILVCSPAIFFLWNSTHPSQILTLGQCFGFITFLVLLKKVLNP